MASLSNTQGGTYTPGTLSGTWSTTASSDSESYTLTVYQLSCDGGITVYSTNDAWPGTLGCPQYPPSAPSQIAVASQTVTFTASASVSVTQNPMGGTWQSCTGHTTSPYTLYPTSSGISECINPLTAPSGYQVTGTTVTPTSLIVFPGDSDNYMINWYLLPTSPNVTATLSASPNPFSCSAGTTLTWSSSNATSCSAPWTASTAVSGSQLVHPATSPLSYSITCTNSSSGKTGSASVSVSASDAVGGSCSGSVPTVTVTASPSSVTSGGSSTISWSSSGATSCSSNSWNGGSTALSGSVVVNPGSTTTYTEVCSNANGSNSGSAMLTVTAGSVPTVTVSASPSSVTSGGSTTITWSSSGATSCSTDAWSGSTALSGSVTVYPGSTTTYTKVCSNANGNGSGSGTVTVTASGGGFDFGISNSGTISIAQGSSGSETIPLTVLSGTSQPVTITASGAPANVTFTYTNQGCSPACNSLVNFTVGASATYGTYPITVTGTANSAGAAKTIILTSGTGWTVPSDWNNSSNKIEVIGGGGGGSDFSYYSDVGGGGGAYAKVSNVTLSPGGYIPITIGAGGTGGQSSSVNATAGGNTTFNNTTVGAGGGQPGLNSFSGGNLVGGTGGTVLYGTGYSGGNGGNSDSINTNYTDAGGGGGAAGPNGPGQAGGAPAGQACGAGGAGDAGSGGATVSSVINFSGYCVGAIGNNGTEWGTAGSGSGASGPGSNNNGTGAYNNGSNGGLYGGGGSGSNSGFSTKGGNGASGVIVITYSPATTITHSTSFTLNVTCASGSTWNGTSCVANAVPTVTTPTATTITTTSALLGANVTSLGSPAVISARGTCWGTTTSPTTNCVPEGGTVTGTYSQSRTGMTPGTLYYYRGYATNSAGTGYSPTATFTTTALPTGTLTPLNPTCTIASGANSCAQTLTWTTTNPIGTSQVTSPSGTPSPITSNNGSQSFSAPYNPSGVNFYLYNNGTILAQTNVSTVCVSGTAWSGSACTAGGTMAGTLTPLNPTCTIASGASSCTQSLTWTTTNPVATSAVTSPTGTPSPSNGNNGSQNFTVPYNSSGVNFFLYNNSLLLAQTNVTTSCASGSSWNGISCSTYSYSLSPNQGTLVVAQGGSQQQETIAVTLNSGSTQGVILSISGAPANLAYNYANNGCNPTCNIFINITAPSSVATGNYPITVNGTSGGVNKSTSFNLNVTAPTSLTVTPSVSPTAYVGNSVSWQFIVTGGTGPYTYTCSGTDFPSPPPASGSFSITYQTVGTKTATCTVKDSLGNTGSASASVQVVINPAFKEF